MVKYVEDREVFLERAQMLEFDDFGFEVLDIIPCSISGWFIAKRRRNELVAFCAANPQYHIVSSIRQIYFNTLVPGAEYLYLGRGEKDPELILIPKRTFARHQEWLIMKLSRDELSSQEDELGRSSKPQIFSRFIK